MSPCQNMQQTCSRFMPDSTQGFKAKENEGTLKETKFPFQRSQRLRSSKASEKRSYQSYRHRSTVNYLPTEVSPRHPKVTRQNCCTRVPGPSILNKRKVSSEPQIQRACRQDWSLTPFEVDCNSTKQPDVKIRGCSNAPRLQLKLTRPRQRSANCTIATTTAACTQRAIPTVV